MSDDVSDEERVARVRIAVDRLPARRRNIFLLNRVEGWTFQQMKEIARALHDVAQEVFHGRRPPWWRRWF